MHRSVLALIAAALALPLLAWDPKGASDVAKRAAEIKLALQDKAPPAQDQYKTERAKQGAAPEWVKKTAWKIEEDGKQYYFGVGSATGVRMPSLAVRVAETKARAAVASLTGQTTVERGSGDGGERVTVKTEGQVSAAPVDWYEAPDGTVFALVVEERDR